MEKITAVIPIRKGSQRVPEKNFKSFYKGKSLLEIKIESLKKVKSLNNIVVNTDSNRAIDIAKAYGVSYFRRDDYFASSKCSQSEFFGNLGEVTQSNIIVHTPCTSPLVKSTTIDSAVQKFISNKNDSYNAVGLVKEYLWYNQKPLNYEIFNHQVPNSQDLPDIFKLTFGFNIIYRDIMIERQNVIGLNPQFYVVDEIEEIDIDSKLDFKFAKFIYDEYRK